VLLHYANAGCYKMLKYPPPTPAEISVFIENDRYVFKTNDDLTIYAFAHDKAGHSECTGECEKTWPPVTAPADAHRVGDWTAIARGDLARQWAYKGKPVYTYVRDEPGKTLGAGMDGAWRIVEP
jgi:predicted lipoprotein with Yx(FWY)xxD motif